jgi:hypothetical protein
MSVSVPFTSFFNDVKICVASYFMYEVSHEGKYCTKFLNQYSFICSKFYKLLNVFLPNEMLFLYSKRLHEQKNITTVNSVTNTWSIQQTPMFHGCTITNKQNVEPWKYCTKFLNQYSFICSKFYKLYKYNINISHNKTTGWRNSLNNLNVNYM